MTTLEFNSQLQSANTISELNQLRCNTGSSKFRSMIKEKVVLIASSEKFERFSCSLTTLKNITPHTDTNTLIELEIPSKNRTFSKYAGQKVLVYINHKEGTKSSTVYGFIKSI